MKGVSFEMEKGEVVSVIGSSGNGKTTLLRCLNFLETADGGEIVVDGKTVFSATDKTVLSQNGEKLTFGMVFQNFNLFPQYTALRNVTLAMDMREERKVKKHKIKGVERKKYLKEARESNERIGKELLTHVGLQDKLSNYPCELSGGQQQRVAIARALALFPDILCFDEPTSALDPELTGEVLRVIKELADQHTTMIIVTHEMAFARDVADKVVFMDGGVVVEQGDPKEVFGNPKEERTIQFLARYKQG